MTLSETEIQLRLGYVEPYEGESISHYLGRLRRFKANSLPSGYSLGQLIGVGSAVTRWEKLYFNPFPPDEALATLAQLIGLDLERLRAMLPQKGRSLQPRPICLCGACYAENPCHRMDWQYKAQPFPVCDRHNLRLLVKCPGCKTPFPVPARWASGSCERCKMKFSSMAKRQDRFHPSKAQPDSNILQPRCSHDLRGAS